MLNSMVHSDPESAGSFPRKWTLARESSAYLARISVKVDAGVIL
jgi:hypothetical protein